MLFPYCHVCCYGDCNFPLLDLSVVLNTVLSQLQNRVIDMSWILVSEIAKHYTGRASEDFACSIGV